ncbi:MAG: hypothetical protein LWX02_08310 [Deltaproteobacteria bacterium]|jgi:hypothetical protein|nr:hypothetical protein [Deltaproteobacteria bacterium]MDL1988136.1 hypothetical protein [Deltaproteobacteria bacterium]MDL2124917.1 hypothetical protein [Deltaproteobacteria bacterium]
MRSTAFQKIAALLGTRSALLCAGLGPAANGAIWYHVAVIMPHIPHKVQTQPDGGEG